MNRMHTTSSDHHRVPAGRFGLQAALVLACSATAGASAMASTLDTLPFASTSDPSRWQVATRVGGVDGDYASFPIRGFMPAVAVVGRNSEEAVGWIANNDTGTNGCCTGNWTFFVFRQSFDLTGYEPSTAQLSFRWAADDSGEGIADRGSWTPKYRVNGGSLFNGKWETGWTYDLGPETVLEGLFRAGVNTIDFYVQGNGVTDGMALTGTLLAIAAVPEPGQWGLMLAGAAALAGLARRRANVADGRFGRL